MSDPRFARLRSDPRFRRPRKQQSKVVVDERFKEAFDKGKKNISGRRVDKYGRPISNTHEQDRLRRFYRLESEEEQGSVDAAPDYARGGVLLESSDEDDDAHEEDDRGTDDIITGRDRSKPIAVPDDAEDEIDLDERTFADLDAQAAAYSKKVPPEEVEGGGGEASHTPRLAVVNLDWDHVRTSHLYKIFSSLVSPTAPSSSHSVCALPGQKRSVKGGSNNVARGKVLNVRIYPSEFGKERMAREEKEGPPAEVFKTRQNENDEEVNERNVYEVGNENEYDEDALRAYQLERLRYYYAIVTCDTMEAASHIYSELEGTELERSANVFDLSFVPNDMTFDDEYRDETTANSNTSYKGIDFVTTALRHSKVQLTWDEDDPERNQITRRTLTRQEIEEAEFKAYIASSGSDSGSDADEHHSTRSGTKKDEAKAASRDKLRALLLGRGDDDLPEGWGRDEREGKGDVDMEITFIPGLGKVKGTEEETTLEKYQKKLREKRKKWKEEVKDKGEAAVVTGTKGTDEEAGISPSSSFRPLSTPEELALLIASDNPNAEPKHFNLKSVLKAEKLKGLRKKGKGGKIGDEDELQKHFSIDVKDDRFKALHDDHTFAIDPSNPRFKKTTSMVALLQERSKRLKDKCDGLESASLKQKTGREAERSLKSLVESVKRKGIDQQPGKRRKL